MHTLLVRIARSKKHSNACKRISSIASILCSLIFVGEIAFFAFSGEFFTAISVAAAAGVGFVAVTLLRSLINAPRPYELRDYYAEAPREKEGKSFPSRHAYSAFVIATLAWVLNPMIAVATALLALIVCIARVVVGIHFVRDVVCGGLIGIFAGVIGILILL